MNDLFGRFFFVLLLSSDVNSIASLTYCVDKHPSKWDCYTYARHTKEKEREKIDRTIKQFCM